MSALIGRFAVDVPNASARQLFDLASDVESYPAFIPWCKSARVVSQDGDVRLVENRFCAGPMDAIFISRAEACAPEKLSITAQTDPFRDFRLEWRFADGVVRADYRIALRSALLQGLAGFAMPEIERRIVARFRRRAAEIYGI